MIKKKIFLLCNISYLRFISFILNFLAIFYFLLGFDIVVVVLKYDIKRIEKKIKELT